MLFITQAFINLYSFSFLIVLSKCEENKPHKYSLKYIFIADNIPGITSILITSLFVFLSCYEEIAAKI